MRFITTLFLAITLLLVGMEGCTQADTEKVSEKKVEASSTNTDPGAETTMPADTTATAEGLSWDIPPGFKAVVPSSSMRVVQYELPASEEGVRAGELALFFFGSGVGGSVDANLERWATQFERPDRKDVMETASIDSFTAESGLKVTTIRLEGTYQPSTMGSERTFVNPRWALHGAVVEGAGGPWFWKAVGPEAVIEHHGTALEELYRSVRLAS